VTFATENKSLHSFSVRTPTIRSVSSEERWGLRSTISGTNEMGGAGFECGHKNACMSWKTASS
jgi:hypothetical protein